MKDKFNRYNRSFLQRDYRYPIIHDESKNFSSTNKTRRNNNIRTIMLRNYDPSSRGYVRYINSIKESSRKTFVSKNKFRCFNTRWLYKYWKERILFVGVTTRVSMEF